MARERTSYPTNAELRILEALWRKGPSTVRQIYEQIGGAGYTTVLKLMQIMLEKGFVKRNESERTHVYSAALPESQVKRGLVGELIRNAFRGSAKDLIVQALSTERSTREELAEIRRLIETMERRKE